MKKKPAKRLTKQQALTQPTPLWLLKPYPSAATTAMLIERAHGLKILMDGDAYQDFARLASEVHKLVRNIYGFEMSKHPVATANASVLKADAQWYKRLTRDVPRISAELKALGFTLKLGIDARLLTPDDRLPRRHNGKLLHEWELI